MAGPVIATLGPFSFEAHGFGLTGVDRSLKTGWAAVKVAGGMDKLQWLGGDNETVNIPGVLFPMEFGGEQSLAGIRQAAIAGQPLPFVQLAGGMNGLVHGMFAIEGVDDKQTFIAPNGVPMKNTYTISMKRFEGSQFSFMSVLGGLL